MAKSMRERIQQRSNETNKLTQRNRIMVAKLTELADNDHIQKSGVPNEYDIGFIRRIAEIVNANKPLSEKQQAHLDKCFEEY